MWDRTLHWFLGLKILRTGLGLKVFQNAPFYTTLIQPIKSNPNATRFNQKKIINHFYSNHH